jgi:hypothetical protein
MESHNAGFVNSRWLKARLHKRGLALFVFIRKIRQIGTGFDYYNNLRLDL